MNYNFDFIDPCMLDITRTQTQKKRLLERVLTVQEFSNALVLPMIFGENILGGVIDCNGNFIPNTGFHVGKEGGYLCNEHTPRFVDKSAIFLGYFNKTWGHCFTDNLKLIWFVLSEDFKQLYENHHIDILYLCDEGFSFSKNFSTLLLWLGVSTERLTRISSPTVYRRLYVPEGCFTTNEVGERFYTKEYVEIINTLLCNIKPDKSYSKVYLTRTHLKGNRDVGEVEIEHVFKKMGYEIIAPEEYDLERQLEIFSGCDTLATTEGSISHNAVFMREGTNLEIIRKVAFVNEYQVAINEIRNLNVTYIDAHLSIFARKSAAAAGPFYLYVNDNLVNFSKGMVEPTFSLHRFKKYSQICLLLPNLEDRIKFDEYYYVKAGCEIENAKSKMRNILINFPFLKDSQKRSLINMGKKILLRL